MQTLTETVLGILDCRLPIQLLGASRLVNSVVSSSIFFSMSARRCRTVSGWTVAGRDGGVALLGLWIASGLPERSWLPQLDSDGCRIGTSSETRGRLAVRVEDGVLV